MVDHFEVMRRSVLLSNEKGPAGADAVRAHREQALEAAQAGAERRNLSRAEYDKVDRVHWSTLKAMARSPAHYQHAAGHGRTDTPALRRGRMVHLAVLEPEAFERNMVVWHGHRRGKAWDAFEEANADVDILTASESDNMRAMADAVRDDPTARDYLAAGAAEQTLLWTHTTPDLAGLAGYAADCKARVDWVSLSRAAIVDLKTARDASPDGFAAASWRYCYHGQAAFYCDGWAAQAQGQRRPYVFIAVEVEPPYVVQVYRLPELLEEQGREHYRNLLARWALCHRERRWPGYAEGELELSPPRWLAPADDIADLDLSFTPKED